jgi:uncharacterized membrane protein
VSNTSAPSPRIERASLRRAGTLIVLLAWCAFLILGRWAWSGHRAFGFLAWNLFLAAVPAFASTVLGYSHRRRHPRVLLWAWGALWLAFLPNAPYIVTDLVHFQYRPPVPLWFDIALMVSAVGTGLLLGYASTAEVQRVVSERRGRVVGWAVACGALLLSGFGIYLGRFMRWNSWDVVTSPERLFGALAAHAGDPSLHARTVAVTLIYGVGVTLGYLGLKLAVPSVDSAHD